MSTTDEQNYYAMKALLQPLITLGIILLCSMQVFAQGVVISEDENATADPSAILDVQSGDKGFLPPRMTTAEWNAIAVPANGLVVYDTDENKLFLYNGTEWVELSADGSRWEADGDDIYRIDGNVGIGINTPGYPLHVETATESRAIYGQNNASSGTTYGVYGQSSSAGSRGVYGVSTSGRGVEGVGVIGVHGQSSSTSGIGVSGFASAVSGTTYGVYGHVNSPDGRGVFGLAAAASGSTYGIYGQSNSPDGTGVLGWVNATIGTTYGVYGLVNSTDGRGVYGLATAGSGTTYGVHGHVNSPAGYAGYFTGPAGSRNYFERSVGIGTDTPSYPLHVETATESRAIYGQNNASSGTTYGVRGESSSPDGRGVYGLASALSGTTYGVYGESHSTDGTGVLGWASGSGVVGYALAGSGTTYGVRGQVWSPGGYAGYFTGQDGSRNYFERSVGIGTLTPNEMLEVDGNIHVSGGNRSIFNRSNNDLAFGTNNTERMRINAIGNVGIGINTPGYPLHVETTTQSLAIYGQNYASSGTTYGVFGESHSTTGRGVYGLATAGSGTTYGVHGHVNSPAGYAGYFTGPAESRNYFERSVGIGTLTPNEMLEVAGNIHVSGNNRTIFNRTNHSLAFGTNNTERMRINANGNVGIGTNTPNYPLHVETATESQAIYGHNSSSGFTYGVWGQSSSTSGGGIVGLATASSGGTYGVLGESNSTAGRGVLGSATASSGTTYGVLGQVNSAGGYAGYFTGPAGSRNYFQRSVGIGTNTPSYPLHVETATESRAIYGQNNASSGTTYGVYGESSSTSGLGVLGWASASSGDTYAVVGESNSTDGTGVFGWATAGSGTTRGVSGHVNSPDGYAGYFTGADGSRNYFERSVGIGTATPGVYKVWVMHGDYGLRLQNTSVDPGSHWELFQSGSDDNLQLYTASDNVGEFDAASGEYSHTSDRKLKHQFAPLSNVLPALNALTVHSYAYRSDATAQRHIGLIAQDVEQFFPELVTPPTLEDGRETPYLMNYAGLGVIAIKGVQELSEITGMHQLMISDQHSQIDALRQENAILRSQLETITSALISAGISLDHVD